MARKKFRVEIRPSLEKELKSIDIRYHKALWSKIESLAEDPLPRGCAKLQTEDDMFRIRIGVFRLVYEIDWRNAIVYAAHIRHRQSSYKKK
jgi:mRNA interferase RelE/StbE